jgi:dTMP kinase
MQTKFAGKFIVLDGPDGCGKSTQAKALAEWLRKQGVDVATFRDPGTTHVGEKIREILLDPQHKMIVTRCEVMLYMAARVQLWEEKIKPALEAGKCVVMDRWLSSTCAYQGFAGGFGVTNVTRIAEICLERVWPDVTLVMDVDQATASRRMDRELDRMEQKGKDYHEKVRKGFLELAASGKNVVVIDASREVGEVHFQVLRQVSEKFGM